MNLKKVFGVFAGTFLSTTVFANSFTLQLTEVTISFLVQGFMQLNNGQSES